MVREVGQQVLGHVLAVEQPEDDALQVLLINEAVLIKVCKEEEGPERQGHQPGPHRLLSASATPHSTQLSQVGLRLALGQIRAACR